MKYLKKFLTKSKIYSQGKIFNEFGTTHMQKWSNIINSVKISKLAHIIENTHNLTYQHCLQIRINCWSDGVRSNCSSTAGIFVIVTCCRLHSFSERLTVSCKGVFTTYLERIIFIKISSRHAGGTQLPGTTQGTPRRYPGDSYTNTLPRYCQLTPWRLPGDSQEIPRIQRVPTFLSIIHCERNWSWFRTC